MRQSSLGLFISFSILYDKFFTDMHFYDKYVFMLAGDIIVMKTKRFKVVFR